MQHSALGTVTVSCNGNSILFSLPENLPQSYSWLPWQITETLKSPLLLPLAANKIPAWNRNSYYVPCTRFFIFCYSFCLQDSSPKGTTFFLTLFHQNISNASQSYVAMFIPLLLCSLHCLEAMTQILVPVGPTILHVSHCSSFRSFSLQLVKNLQLRTQAFQMFCLYGNRVRHLQP